MAAERKWADLLVPSARPPQLEPMEQRGNPVPLPPRQQWPSSEPWRRRRSAVRVAGQSGGTRASGQRDNAERGPQQKRRRADESVEYCSDPDEAERQTTREKWEALRKPLRDAALEHVEAVKQLRFHGLTVERVAAALVLTQCPCCSSRDMVGLERDVNIIYVTLQGAWKLPAPCYRCDNCALEAFCASPLSVGCFPSTPGASCFIMYF